MINVGNKFDKLKEAFDQIFRGIASQYNIGYTSTNTSSRHVPQLEIKNKQGYKIQTRAGYYAPRGEPACRSMQVGPTFESGGCCPCFRCKTSLPLPFRTKNI